MPGLVKAIFLGVLIGIGGLLLSFVHISRSYEENVGLGLLFKLRGVRQPPSDVVVVSIDKDSSENLNVSDNPDKWPRSLHARLTDKLAREGAKVMTFDVHFLEPRSTEDDKLFAEAIGKARNVVLAEPLTAKEVPMSRNGGDQAEANSIVRIVKPYEPFARAAIGTAPFVLPRIPFKVNQYWTFQQGAGDSPTFPVVAFQLFALQVYKEFVHLLDKVSPNHAGTLPRDADTAMKTRGVVGVIRDIRDIFESDPLLADRMLTELERSDLRDVDVKSYRLLKSLIKLYGGAHSRYFNFYGPPRTITTVPYYQALPLGEGAGTEKQVDLKGKAVFVGLSEILLAERKDSFYTVFSQANGVFISGVEIAATAFSNILEDSSVKPISLRAHLLILLLWGLLVGVICRIAPIVVAAVGSVGLSILYLGAAAYQFKTDESWYPLVIPLFFQTPLAFVSATVWNYLETDKERKNIRKAFGYYLPNDVVDQLAKNIANIKGSAQVVYGTCLFTDAGEYTTLSETMSPKELSDFIGKYFEALFEPVRKQDGLIVDLKGDSILAIWKAAHDEATLRRHACLAALDIAKGVDRFNRSVAPLGLPTRIGLHAGELTIGTVGAVDHYEYRPTGDVVNTASRVEGFNKSLGTQIAVTDDVIRGLDGFLTRELGTFRLKGKAKPLVIHELVCRLEESDENQRRACALFAEALGAFRRQSWDEAVEQFHQCIETLGKDGPSHFYITLCEQYSKSPAQETWDEVVTLEKK